MTQTKTGTSQGEMVRILDQVTKVINGITAKLDADAGITDTNYEAIWGTDGSDSDAIQTGEIDSTI